MLGVMAGWVTSPLHGVSEHFRGADRDCARLLLARVISWDDLLAEHRAWDALIWFAPLVMMSDVLNENGAIKVLSADLFAGMSGWPWPLAMAGTGDDLLLHALRVRQHDGTGHGAVSGLSGGDSGGGRAPDVRRPWRWPIFPI